MSNSEAIDLYACKTQASQKPTSGPLGFAFRKQANQTLVIKVKPWAPNSRHTGLERAGVMRNSKGGNRLQLYWQWGEHLWDGDTKVERQSWEERKMVMSSSVILDVVFCHTKNTKGNYSVEVSNLGVCEKYYQKVGLSLAKFLATQNCHLV